MKRTIHGIDLHAPGGLEALFAYRRAQFGDAVMQAAGDPAPTGDPAPAAPGTPPAAAAPPAGTTPPAGGTPPAAAPAAPAAPAWDGKVESLHPDAQKIITDLRKEAGDERVAAKTLAAIQKALNPEAGDAKPDAEQLTKDLAARDTAAKQALTELAVFRAASKAGADPDALLDSRAFLAKIADIDPAKTADIQKAIEDAVKENPKLKVVLAASKSGGDFTGGPGEQRNAPTTLEDAVAQKMARN